MNFTSLEFALFLPLVFSLYWLIGSERRRTQNWLLLIASYLFYGWWDWRFLVLIFFSSIIDYLLGIKIFQTDSKKRRKWYLIGSLSFNLVLLGFFKYFNFFIDSYTQAFTFLGAPITPSWTLNILLPVGISFYTFQSMSYTIDIYKRKFAPTHHPVDFLAFVAFFPQLVAGPIERASHLLPQFTTIRKWHHDTIRGGAQQIAWGLFKKIVIADNAAIYVNEIFANYASLDTTTLLLGAFLFSIQIYGDFSGYSDIALGTSRLFGFNLNKNFDLPYFAPNIHTFWKKWHISLTSWFRDYVYIPLGGSHKGTIITLRNTFMVFLISGFWHGANWTFILWGLFHALFFLPIILMKKKSSSRGESLTQAHLTGLRTAFSIFGTFLLVSLLWVLFRSPSVTDAFAYYHTMLTGYAGFIPTIFPKKFLVVLTLFVLVEWLQRSKDHPLDFTPQEIPSRFVRWAIYYLLILMIWQLSAPTQQFIYFQF